MRRPPFDECPGCSCERCSPRRTALGRRKAYPSRPGLFYQRAWPNKWIGQRFAAGENFALDADGSEAAGVVGTGAPAFLRTSLELPTYGAGEAPAQELDDESERALRALGYLDE